MQIKDTPKVYDVIIVGSGAGGGMAAHELTKAGAEVLLPEPVHGDAGGERVAGIDEPAGEGETVPRFRRGEREGEKGGHLRRDLFSRLIVESPA